MIPSCVNGGGLGSILRLGGVPQLDRETALAGDAGTALRSWCARPGEIVTVIDGEGACYRLRLTTIAPEPRGIPFQRFDVPVESRLAIDVYQALPERERFELVLQKLTELGVARIVPVETSRSTTLAARDAVQAKSHRWPDVIRRAARQCRRAMLPELFAAVGFTEALAMAGSAELKLLLYEGEGGWPLAEALGRLRPERVACLVGPEGGFSDEELASASSAGFLPINLGPRLLRTETAAIVCAALLQGLRGDLC